MKSLLSVVVLVGALLLPAARSAAQEPGQRQIVDGIAAVVGDEIILDSEVDEELYIYQMRSGGIKPEDALKVKSDILRGMIEETLLVAMAHRDTVTLQPGELDQEMDRRVTELEQRHGSKEALESALESEGLTLDKLKQIYSKEIERRLLAQKVVRNEVQSRIDVTWGEVTDYYEQHKDEVGQVPEAYHLAGILITPKVSEAAKLAAMQRMQQAAKELADGTPFGEVAKKYSDDASATRGGDIGTVRRGMMVPEFEDALFSLEEGEVSGIVPTRFGYHIIQVTEKGDDYVKARHILARVAPGPEDEERARATADSLSARAIAGEDFAELARARSDDPISSESGGDLGWFSRSDLSPVFAGVVQDMSAGEIAQPIKGETGFYVLKVLEHNPPRVASLDEIRDDLRDLIFSQKAEEAYNKLIDRLKSEIFVDVRTDTAPKG
jgi:peptidyl-prolyl cis-trans isomerase SurA